jgi:acetoin:2,6-dichlorophenolindophenol oxidoreductase subunit beta
VEELMADVVMPRMGETVDEGTVNEWFKQVGDPVTEGEPLLEIGTDKVDTEIPAPATGVLAEIRVAEGQTVPVATVLAVITLFFFPNGDPVSVITYREAVARGIAQEMRRDPNVVFLGEDVAAAGGVFKTTVGLLEEFGPDRVRDTPISEQAILGAAVGAAMTGLRPIAEIMFSDFFAVCWDLIANEMAKIRYMSDGQLALPLVVRTANGAGVRFGAQHSQSVENWAMAVPGLKVVAPSSPRDVVGLLAAAVRDPDPVVFFEHKGLMASKGEVPDGTEVVDELGRARVLREGGDATILALAMMVPRALTAAERLSAEHGIEATVVDVRSLVPLDTRTILDQTARTGRLFTVEENPRLCGWGAEIVSIVAEEAFGALSGPPVRITTPHIPLPAADRLEDHVLPSVDRITETVRKALQ